MWYNKFIIFKKRFMPRKQKQVSKRKSMGLHILGVSLFTLLWVGGNVFILLSPLYAASFSKKHAVTANTLPNNKMLLVRPQQNSSEDNIVYAVKLNSGYKIYQSGQFIRPSSEMKSADQKTYLYDNNQKIDLSKIEKTPLLQIPSGSMLNDYLVSDDGKLAIFTVYSPVNFTFLSNKDGFGQNQVLSSVFSYDTEKNKLTLLFTNTDYAGLVYISPRSISEDKDHIAFDSHSCLECGAQSYTKTFVYEVSTKTLKQVGTLSDFRWTTGKNFEYKEVVDEKCSMAEDSTGIPCEKDSKDLPFKKGSWK
jgi:hypothetical protein